MRNSRRGGGGGQRNLDGELSLDDKLSDLMSEMGPATYLEIAIEADKSDIPTPDQRHQLYIRGLKEQCRHLGKQKEGGLAKRFSLDEEEDSISYPRKQLALFQREDVAKGLVRQRGRIDRTLVAFNRETMERFGVELKVMQSAAGKAIKLGLEQGIYTDFTPDPDDDDEEE